MNISKVVSSSVLNQGIVNVCQENSFNIFLTPLHAPFSSLLVYYVNKEKNVSAQIYRINIPDFSTNSVIILFTFKLNQERNIINLSKF